MDFFRKFTFYILATGILGGLYWYLMVPPKFDGPSASQKAMVWEFDRALTDSERARVVLFENPLLDYSKTLELARNGQTDLTQDEIDSLEKMSSFRDSIVEEVKELHTKLSKDDIRWITQENPLSLYTLFDTFIMKPSPQPDCTIKDIEKLSEKLGLNVLLSAGKALVFYPWMREMQFTDGYLTRLKDLVKSDPRFSRYKDLEKTYFKYSSYKPHYLKSLTEGLGTDPEASLNRARQKILEAGQNEISLDQDLFSLASLAPGCFVNPLAFSRAESIWRREKVPGSFSGR